MAKARPKAWLFDAEEFLAHEPLWLMSPAGRGAYIVLLCRAYLRTPPASLPADDKAIAALALMSLDDWLAVKSEVIACWELQGNVYVNQFLRGKYERSTTSMR